MTLHNTKSALLTKKLAASLAEKYLRKTKSRGNALIFALAGDLGSGKTTFIQGFSRALGVKKRITSPTFVIMKKFQIPNPKSQTNSKFKIPKNIYHVDCYRIRKPKEILDLGFKEIINEPQNTVLIEWADRIKKLLPKKTIWLNFGHGERAQKRIIKIKN